MLSIFKQSRLIIIINKNLLTGSIQLSIKKAPRQGKGLSVNLPFNLPLVKTNIFRHNKAVALYNHLYIQA